MSCLRQRLAGSCKCNLDLPVNDLTEKTLAKERKYTGKIISVDLLDIELPDGRKAKRETAEETGYEVTNIKFLTTICWKLAR